MNGKENSLLNGSALGRDRRNRRLVTIWSMAWGLAFTFVAFGIKRLEWSSEATLAGVIGTASLGFGTVVVYRRFLLETDELRRKIEVEALALAFGVGVFGGLSCWLLAVSGALAIKDFAFVFAAMIFTHVLGVFLGCRRYS